MNKVKKRCHKRGWSDEENSTLREWYTEGLAIVQILLPKRSGDAIRKQALFLGLTTPHGSAEECAAPLPAMSVDEKADCALLRNWKYPIPVSGQLVGWRIRYD